MKLLDFLNYIQPELLVPFLASFWGCGACQVRFRDKKYLIYKAKIEIFSILDIYAHNFNSSGALENKYYATKKLLESGLIYQDITLEAIWRSLQIEDNIGWWNPPHLGLLLLHNLIAWMHNELIHELFLHVMLVV